ncbi:DUF4214 domain-containing protein [Campylobacter sp. 46490-21]|uniref:DUF4214 domain-containing protein n=1 Tax=Campylobacter magnus TaxID=3026462 RepID=UPI00236051C8|nr:DUF4214 domain-containing protein [Campylobacter magnus]MDD0847318.1 DUF4214 domain-containing protein [Campylobacter magnus]
MALTNQQVQQVFLAITGRPAEGSAVAWGANSLSVAALANAVVDIRKGADFANSKEAFVENLYSQLLGRPSDAEGKEFWLNALNNGASYGDVLSQFVNAVLAQPSSADLYTLQNKLSIAEQISAQINTFQGGAAAEATLKALMKDVNANTTIDSIQDSVDNFVGNSVNIKTVTINPADTDPAEIKGSAENATVFNLSLDVASENPAMQQILTGSTKFADTLNVKVTSSDKDNVNTLDSIGTISNIKTLNITTDATIETTNIGNIPAGVKNINFTGKSNDTFTITSAADSVSTGAGNDTVIVSVAKGVKSVNLGAGDNDTLSLTGDQTALTSVLGVENLTLANGTTLKSSILSGKDYNVAATTGFVVDAKGASTVDLGSLQNVGAVTVNINNVGSNANITLANTTGVQTVVTNAATFGIKVSGAEKGDKLNFAANADAKTVTGDSQALTLSTGITDTKFEIVSAGADSVTAAMNYLKANITLSSGAKQFATANAKAIVAFSDSTKNQTNLYLANDKNGNQVLDNSELQLLGTVEMALTAGSGNTSASAGVITLG